MSGKKTKGARGKIAEDHLFTGLLPKTKHVSYFLQGPQEGAMEGEERGNVRGECDGVGRKVKQNGKIDEENVKLRFATCFSSYDLSPWVTRREVTKRSPQFTSIRFLLTNQPERVGEELWYWPSSPKARFRSEDLNLETVVVNIPLQRRYRREREKRRRGRGRLVDL